MFLLDPDTLFRSRHATVGWLTRFGGGVEETRLLVTDVM